MVVLHLKSKKIELIIELIKQLTFFALVFYVYRSEQSLDFIKYTI